MLSSMRERKRGRSKKTERELRERERERDTQIPEKERMVAVPRKRLVLVAFFLLCFISITAKASRSVRKESRTGGADQKGDGNETFSPKAKGEVSEGNSDQDLATMDYTPAQKRPPIHN